MKKVMKLAALVLALCSILCVLASCSNVEISNQNLQKYNCYYYDVSNYERYQLEFSGTTFRVDHQYYTPSSSSPSGKTLDSSKSTSKTYSYAVIYDTKVGKYGISVGESIYYCEFYKHSGEGYGLKFEEPFLNIGTRW